MEQLKRLMTELSIRQKFAIGFAVVLAAAGIYGLYYWQREADYMALYKSLAAEDASAVVQKLKESGVEYRLTENGATILVPSRKVAEMRLELAGAGLPRSGRIGFELFDKANFGVTDFAEHVNYRRALEGELERSVISIAEVEHARVHITFPKDSVFLESQQAAKASVLVRLRTGVRLSPQNVLAITHLVSSAVEGLSPESVSVLDMHGNLLSRPKRPSALGNGAEANEASLEYQQKVERELLAKINSALEPLMGPDRFRAGVSAECDFTGGEQSEETFDPSKSVMLSSSKTEDASGATMASGTPGTASNLSSSSTRAGSGRGFARRSENVAYQTSRVVRHLRLAQGTIKRMSVAVMLDQDLRWEGSGRNPQRVLVPPSAEKLTKIRDLIAGIIGFTPERGDKLVVDSLPFENTLNAEPPVRLPSVKSDKNNVLDQMKEHTRLLVAGIAAGTLLLLLLAWMMLGRRKPEPKPARRRAVEDDDLYLPPAAARTEAPAPALPAVAETSAASAATAHEPAPVAAVEAAPVMAGLPEPAATLPVAGPERGLFTRIETLADEVRDAVDHDAELCVTILRGWLREEAK